LQSVDDDGERLIGGEVADHGDELSADGEGIGDRGVGCAETAKGFGDVDVGQELGQDTVGEPALPFIAAGRDDRDIGVARQKVPDECALAHARGAVDDDDLRAAGPHLLEPVIEFCELGTSPNKHPLCAGALAPTDAHILPQRDFALVSRPARPYP
jgi:hypothetical protein